MSVGGREGEFAHPSTPNWPPPAPSPKKSDVSLPGGGSIKSFSGSFPGSDASRTFRLPGGGWGAVGHIPHPPTATPTRGSPQGANDPSGTQVSGDPPGQLSTLSFAGADTNATHDGQPPDVAADVSSEQEVEFVNGDATNSTTGLNSTNTAGGVYVYDTSGVQQSFTNDVTFCVVRTPSVGRRFQVA